MSPSKSDYKKYREKCIHYQKGYYQKNKVDIAKYKKEYRSQNREKITKYKREYRKKERLFWDENSVKDYIKRSEPFIIEKILPNLGFENILVPSPHFYFDCLAKKNGIIHAVEITTSYRRTLKKHRIDFLNYFEIPFIVFFLKPDFSRYYIVKQNAQNYNVNVYYRQGEEVMIEEQFSLEDIT